MQTKTSESLTRNVILFVTTVTTIITPYMNSSVNIALPSIAKELSLDAVTLSWVVSIYLLGSAVFCIPFGRLADMLGRRKVFFVGMSVYILASFFLSSASSGTMLLLLRGVQALGASMLYGTCIAILVAVYPPKDRGKVLGINAAATYFGLSVGPFIGGLLTQTYGWRSMFFVIVPLGLVVLAASLWKMPWEKGPVKKARFDFFGTIIYSLSLISFTYGLSSLPQLSGILFVTGAIIGMITFGYWEMRIDYPILNLKLLLHNRVFAFSNMAALINFSATYSINFLLSPYLQYIKGFSPLDAGKLLLYMPIVQAVLSPFVGRLSDRVRPQVMAAAGMAITALGLSSFIFLSETTPDYQIVGGLIVCGIGLAMFASPNSNAIMSSIDSGSYGVASGTMQTMRLVGQNLSVSIATLIIALLIGRVQIKPENYPVFLQCVKIAFTVMTPLAFVAVFASLGGLWKKQAAPVADSKEIPDK